MTVLEVLGVERRRRWSDATKASILSEVGVDGWTVSDVARRHDVTRQHLYQWRRDLRQKGVWPGRGGDAFVAVELLPVPADACAPAAGEASMSEVTIILGNGRQLRCRETIGDAELSRLLRVLEAA